MKHKNNENYQLDLTSDFKYINNYVQLCIIKTIKKIKIIFNENNFLKY